MKKGTPPKKISTDDLVKNLFDPVQKETKSGTATEEISAPPADIFFDSPKTPPVESYPKSEPLPPLVPEMPAKELLEKRLAFNPLPWTAAVSFLFLTAYLGMSVLQQNDGFQSATVFLKAKQNQLDRFQKVLTLQTPEAARTEKAIQDRLRERKDLLDKQNLLRKSSHQAIENAISLAVITQNLPSSMRLEKLTVEGRRFYIKGFTNNFDEVVSWMLRLKDRELIRADSTLSIVTNTTMPSKITEFKIDAELVS